MSNIDFYLWNLGIFLTTVYSTENVELISPHKTTHYKISMKGLELAMCFLNILWLETFKHLFPWDTSHSLIAKNLSSSLVSEHLDLHTKFVNILTRIS